MSQATMMIFHEPEPAILQALGMIALRHSQLDHMLKMVIKSLAEITVQEAQLATAFQGSAVLRERINKLARRRLGEGSALLRLQALLERARLATEKRNAFVHGIWARELDGEPQTRSDQDHAWRPLPTLEDLQALANDLLRLSGELNTARLEGFLAEAIAKTKAVS